MDRNMSVTIEPCENGFVVYPALTVNRMGDFSRGRVEIAETQTRVFQTFAELTAFLAEHFPHRSSLIRQDVLITAGGEAGEYQVISK